MTASSPPPRGRSRRIISSTRVCSRAAAAVRDSGGVERTKQLAVAYGDEAIAAALTLAPSPERNALIHLVAKVVARDA